MLSTRRFLAALMLLLLCWLITALLPSAQAQQSQQVRTDQVQATLLAHAPQGIAMPPAAAESGQPSLLTLGDGKATGFTLPGSGTQAPQANTASDAPPADTFEVWLGLHLQHAPKWHTYWKNPGDSGLPTELQWHLPAGVSADPIDWPTPQKIFIGDMANYGYEGDVLLPVRLRFSPEFAVAKGQQTLPVGLSATWLVCHEECIPQSGQFQLEVPLYGSTALDSQRFQTAWQQRPETLRLNATAGRSHATLSDDHTRLLVQVADLPAAWHGQAVLWLPETSDVLVNGSRPVPADKAPLSEREWTQRWQGGVWHASLPISPFRGNNPDTVTLLLLPQSEAVPNTPSNRTTNGAPAARLVLPVQGTWPALNRPAQISPELQAALDANTAKAQASVPVLPTTGTSLSGWLLALGGALLGGLLLNLMPCVFPVLAIKLLGFSQANNASQARASALGYCAGVVLTCLALGGLLLALRAAGQQLGWGFQLQSPWMVLALAALFTAIALNLFGLFDVRVDRATASLPHEIRSNPTLDNVYAGVLAVVVATPCTAPFMGASMGLAVSLPAWQALGIFAALGLGLALPVLVTLAFPSWLRWLPRSGAWMQRVRELLGFPMLATVIWLLWVLGQQVGIDGLIAALVLLVAEAMALWLWFLPGRFKALRFVVGVAIVTPALAWAWPALTQAPTTAAQAPNASANTTTTGWQPWSQTQVDEALAQGQPVFIDFTAAWCITCQYNKKTTLADADVLAAFAAKRVRLLRADWTRQDPRITAALQALGRSGVPVYVLHAPNRPPKVFTEILQASALHAALNALPD